MSEAGVNGGHYAYPLVTWGSTLLGAAMALITSLMLNLLGAAIGVAYATFGQTTGAAALSGVVGILWVAMVNLVALGFGAWVAGRATANPDHHGGTLQGIAVWAVTSFAILFLASSAVAGVGNLAIASADVAAKAASSATVSGPAANATGAGDSQGSGNVQSSGNVQDSGPSGANAAALQSAGVTAADAVASAAFGTFLAMVLGLVAAIYGARAGARHPNWADRPRFTYVERSR